MPLTFQVNGTGSSSLIKASWWNDYYNLVTGVMTDQPVTFKPNVTMQAIAGPPTAPTTVTASGGSMGVGTYKYVLTYLTADGGETLQSPSVTATTTSTNKTQTLTIPTGPTGTSTRNLYRTQLNGSTYYFLASIANNTATSYSDSVADTALVTTHVPPIHPTFGGAIVLKDQTGTTNLIISSDGSISGATSGSGLSNTTISGTLNVTGATTLASDLFLSNGKLSYATSGDLIDASSSSVTYIKSRSSSGTVVIQNNGSAGGGTPLAVFGNGGLSIYQNVNVNGGQKFVLNYPTSVQGESAGSLYIGSRAGASNPDLLLSNSGAGYITLGASSKHVTGRDATGATTWMDLYQTGSVLVLQNGVSNGPIGFRNTGGKLAECQGNGNFIINGTTYYTAQSTVSYSASGTFDGFDFSECFQMDQEYPAGTVVCPNDVTTTIAYDGTPQVGVPILTQCTHDGCSLALVVVTVPAFCAGAPNVPSQAQFYDNTQPIKQPAAMTGRIFAKTAYDIPARSYVCSDGRGGVRTVVPGDKVMALGVTLSPVSSGMVPLLIRPGYIAL